MTVPVVVAARLSPVKSPELIETVADARFVLSTSVTVSVGSTAVPVVLPST